MLTLGTTYNCVHDDGLEIASKPKHCRNLRSSELLLKSVYCVGSIFMQLILCAWLHVQFLKVVSSSVGIVRSRTKATEFSLV